MPDNSIGLKADFSDAAVRARVLGLRTSGLPPDKPTVQHEPAETLRKQHDRNYDIEHT